MPTHTIAENLQRLVDAKADIASAITTMGGTVNSGDGFEEFPADIATIPSGGGGGAPSNDVNFYDYDGTIVNSYSAAEFAQLSEMPANPSHTGLTAQGWNWSLTDAKAYVASYGKLDIGQMYVTSDGKTRIYITLTEGRTSPILRLYLNANSEIDVDWGDGTAQETLTSTSAGYVSSNRHEYASAGDYIIAITFVSGGCVFGPYLLSNGNNLTTSPDAAYLNAIKKCEIGNSVTSIGGYAFYNCYSLSSITIPNSVTSIGEYTFSNCSSLSSITIPNSVTRIGNSAFYNCYSLSYITIPSSVTSIGESAFSNCSSLSSITIPSSVTSIGGYAFSNCSSLSSITIPNSVTSIGGYTFSNCSSLSSITIPSSVTSIGGYAFYNCYSLSSITINKPEGSISGSPWGAAKGSPTYTQIIWTG